MTRSASPTQRLLVLTLSFAFLFLTSLAPAAEQHFLYVTVPDGAGGTPGHGIHIFDIENGHKYVRTIDIPDMGGTRGVCASAATNKLYYAHGNTKLACLDLITEKKLWENNYPKSEGGCDRIQITPDGKKLYVPSGWWSTDPYNKVVDAATGKLITKIHITDAGGCHNTIMSLDGKRAYCASTKYNMLSVVDTATDKIIQRVGPFNSMIWPHTVNGAQTLNFVNADHIVGFEIGDPRTGKKLHTVMVKGMEDQKRRCHGIGLTPDETEVWLVDQNEKHLHIFDATVMPPVQKQTINVSVKTHGWITFSMDGRFAYPDTGDVIDTKTKKIIATLKDADGNRVTSSKFIEIHFRDGDPIKVGQQMGLGRVVDDSHDQAAKKAQKNWISLFDGKSLKGWEATKFGGEGEVTVDDGRIVLGMGFDLTGITLKDTKNLLRNNYEIAVEAMRVDGSDFFSTITFPVKKDPCSLVVGGWGGGVCGLSSIDWMDASENETTTFRSFKNGQWYRIRVRVTDKRIEAWIDDEQVVDQDIVNRKISVRLEVELSEPLGIASWQTKAAIRSIRIRRLTEKEILEVAKKASP